MPQDQRPSKDSIEREIENINNLPQKQDDQPFEQSVTVQAPVEIENPVQPNEDTQEENE